MALTSLRIRVGDNWYSVEVGDLAYSPVEVTVEGETFHVEVDGLPPRPADGPRPQRRRTTEIVQPPPRRPGGAAADPSDSNLRSPMAGRVIAIMVRPGDQVSVGDEVCVVEAMKMEQSIRAVRSGVVKTIHVQPMDSVSANDLLIELE